MPAASPLVTFIVPCYNYGRYLGECLDAIFAQTIPDFEVVVVDDASTDDTRQVAARYRDARLRYIDHETNSGIAGALATGFAAARGAYIARIDADDRYRPYFLEETVRVLDERPEVGLVYGDVAAMNADGVVFEDPWSGIRSREVHGGRDAQGDEFLANLEENVIPAPAVIGRRDAWMRGLPFPAWFTYQTLSDWYLNVKAAQAYPVYYRARTLSDYRIHPLNLHRKIETDRRREQTIVAVLDEMLAGTDRRREKAAVRRRLYARAYLDAANGYFGLGMQADARRCYLRAFGWRPDYALHSGNARHLAGTLVGPAMYEKVKRLLAS